MEFPTVKSCCCMNLKTFGHVFGIVQIIIYSVAILFALYFRGHLMLPIMLMPIAVNICWIYGIQEKKPMLMLPAMIPFVLASLVCIFFITVYPIVVTFLQPAFISQHHICTSYENYQSAGILTSSQSCTSEYYIDTKMSAKFLAYWITCSAISCIVLYMTIVLYSVYKSVEALASASNPNQNIGSRV